MKRRKSLFGGRLKKSWEKRRRAPDEPSVLSFGNGG